MLAQLRPTLRSTTVCTCRRDLESSHGPDGKIADALASTPASTTAADAPVNYSRYVPPRPQKFSSPRWEKCSRACFDSRLHNCGQRFCHLQYVRAAETLKVPIAPMGKWLTCLPRLPLQQLRPTHRSTTECTCRRDLQCFPSPRWDFHMFCACACRAAVSMSRVAR